MNELKIGTWLSSGSETIAEIASLYGFDWLLLDLEHGLLFQNNLLNNIRAIRSKNQNIKMIVRIPSLEASTFTKILDLGVDGIMVPHIESKEEAVSAVKAMNYPAIGTRGFSGSARAYDYGLKNVKEIISKKENLPILILQIESLKGVNNSAEIANTEGVDVLFVGPADLGLDLSTQNTDITVDDCTKIVSSNCEKFGKKSGILVRDMGKFSSLKEEGFSFLAVSSDTAILRSGYKNLIDSINKNTQ